MPDFSPSFFKPNKQSVTFNSRSLAIPTPFLGRDVMSYHTIGVFKDADSFFTPQRQVSFGSKTFPGLPFTVPT